MSDSNPLVVIKDFFQPTCKCGKELPFGERMCTVCKIKGGVEVVSTIFKGITFLAGLFSNKQQTNLLEKQTHSCYRCGKTGQIEVTTCCNTKICLQCYQSSITTGYNVKQTQTCPYCNLITPMCNSCSNIIEVLNVPCCNHHICLQCYQSSITTGYNVRQAQTCPYCNLITPMCNNCHSPEQVFMSKCCNHHICMNCIRNNMIPAFCGITHICPYCRTTEYISDLKCWSVFLSFVSAIIFIIYLLMT